MKELNDIVASLGLEHAFELNPSLLMRRVSSTTVKSYAQLYDYLESGELLDQPPKDWVDDWQRATAETF